MKLIQTPRSLPILNKKKQSHLITPVPPPIPMSSPKVVPTSPKQQSSQISNEAETMLHDLESSLAQFLTKTSNTNPISLSRTTTTDEEQNRKSLPMIRSLNNINHENVNPDLEPSMRVEWLDDAMRAERKKMIDEDESNVNSQQASLARCSQLNIGQKRPLVDSNFDQSFNPKKCRI